MNNKILIYGFAVLAVLVAYLMGRVQTLSYRNEATQVPLPTQTYSPPASATIAPQVIYKNNPAVVLPTQPVARKRVSYIVTQSGAYYKNGTYYCFEDRVNELAQIESKIKACDAKGDSCGYKAETDGKNCTANCPTADVDAYSACSKSCYDNAYSGCVSEGQECGNLRKELVNKIYEICP